VGCVCVCVCFCDIGIIQKLSRCEGRAGVDESIVKEDRCFVSDGDPYLPMEGDTDLRQRWCVRLGKFFASAIVLMRIPETVVQIGKWAWLG